jgi:hypothetical protein
VNESNRDDMQPTPRLTLVRTSLPTLQTRCFSTLGLERQNQQVAGVTTAVKRKIQRGRRGERKPARAVTALSSSGVIRTALGPRRVPVGAVLLAFPAGAAEEEIGLAATSAHVDWVGMTKE